MTTDNSRADALTDAQIIDLIYECDIPPYCELAAIDFARRLLLAVSQPAAAPIPEDCDVRNILLDVVPGEDGEGQEVYARNVADVERLLSEMGEKLDAAKQPAPSPAEERAASWYCCDPVQICSAQCDSCAKQARAALTAIVDERAECIAWANANGFTKYHGSLCAAWEERARRAAQQLSTEIAELKIKLVSYEIEREDQTRYLAAQSEEIADLKQQLAHADARVGLTAEARATIMDACRSISRGADGLKAGCAIGDEWPDAEDKAFYDAELRLLARLVALLNDSGQSEPETATVARIEQLRKALFESRDAMRVMSNWAKKPDPAGHSWAVRMVDRANAALNGEPEPRSEVTDDDKLCAELYRWLRERAWYVDAATYALGLRERWRNGDEPPPDADDVEQALAAARAGVSQ
ncbi:gp39 [Burkholderia pseudomallei]|uniref:hypothetical protein n=1 Tax=Burkholderia pseudomallei TaxID=28450 RepID=UPI000F16BBB2|nr:hypothetical protein [Burkholderia pseudomallei]VBH35066.1 gp39 [Burkholderia pseudomallei]